jgi:hypothetical protein
MKWTIDDGRTVERWKPVPAPSFKHYTSVIRYPATSKIGGFTESHEVSFSQMDVG